MLWTDSTLAPIDDADGYTDAEGVYYPGQYPKGLIPGLRTVVPTQRPDEGAVIVTGHRVEEIDGVPTEAWNTEPRPVAAPSPEELAAQARRDVLVGAADALARSDNTVLRCVEAGIPVPTDWIAYRQALRAIISADGDGVLPERPDWPAGT